MGGNDKNLDAILIRLQFLSDIFTNIHLSQSPFDLISISGKRFLNCSLVDLQFKTPRVPSDPQGLLRFKNEKGQEESIPVEAINVVNILPASGLTEDDLAMVDMKKGDRVMGANGETLREMIRISYVCQNDEENDFFLRRALAIHAKQNKNTTELKLDEE